MSTTSSNVGQKKEESKGVLEGAYDAAASAATSVKDTIAHGWDATKAKFDEKSAESSKEANWQKAKDSDNTLGERVSGATQSAGDYLEEKSSGAKYQTHKEAAKHQ